MRVNGRGTKLLYRIAGLAYAALFAWTLTFAQTPATKKPGKPARVKKEAATHEQVGFNTATKEQLMAIPRIGESFGKHPRFGSQLICERHSRLHLFP